MFFFKKKHGFTFIRKTKGFLAIFIYFNKEKKNYVK